MSTLPRTVGVYALGETTLLDNNNTINFTFRIPNNYNHLEIFDELLYLPILTR